MQLFDQSIERLDAKENKVRGSKQSQGEKISLPYFTGNFRASTPEYSIPAKVVEYQEVKPTKKNPVPFKIVVTDNDTEVEVKPLLGTAIITLGIAYCYCAFADYVVEKHEAFIAEGNKGEDFKEPPFNCDAIALYLNSQGFSEDEYTQGSVRGATRIRSHIRAHIKKNPQLNCLKVSDSGRITGMNFEIAQAIIDSM